MFADDTTCTSSDTNLENLVKLINTELTKITRWFQANTMAVNVSKI
jgi:hypothetical protein